LRHTAGPLAAVGDNLSFTFPIGIGTARWLSLFTDAGAPWRLAPRLLLRSSTAIRGVVERER
jgi:hypothetical protein